MYSTKKANRKGKGITKGKLHRAFRMVLKEDTIETQSHNIRGLKKGQIIYFIKWNYHLSEVDNSKIVKVNSWSLPFFLFFSFIIIGWIP